MGKSWSWPLTELGSSEIQKPPHDGSLAIHCCLIPLCLNSNHVPASLIASLVLAVSVAANPSVVRKVPMLLPFARHLNTLARRMLSKWIKPTPKKKKFLSAKKVSRAPTKAVVSVRLMSASSTKLAPALVPHPQSVSDAASNMIYALRLVFRQSPD
jgi:hypothetical protein